MKRIISIIIAAIMLASSCISFSFAATINLYEAGFWAPSNTVIGNMFEAVGASPVTTKNNLAIPANDLFDKVLYPGAVRMEVSFTAPKTGEYLVLLFSGDNSFPQSDSEIYYINQTSATADSVVNFNVYPSDAVLKDQPLQLLITNNAGAESISVRLGYTSSMVKQVDSLTKGDLNGDGSANSLDAVYVCKYLVNQWDFTQDQLNSAMVTTKDTKVDINDALQILYNTVHPQ